MFLIIYYIKNNNSFMIWNKDMFKEAGLDPENPPETWDELIDASQKLTKDFDGDGSVSEYISPRGV